MIIKIQESLKSDDLILLEYDALADFRQQEHTSQQVAYFDIIGKLQEFII